MTCYELNVVASCSFQLKFNLGKAGKFTSYVGIPRLVGLLQTLVFNIFSIKRDIEDVNAVKLCVLPSLKPAKPHNIFFRLLFHQKPQFNEAARTDPAPSAASEGKMKFNFSEKNARHVGGFILGGTPFLLRYLPHIGCLAGLEVL